MVRDYYLKNHMHFYIYQTKTHVQLHLIQYQILQFIRLTIALIEKFALKTFATVFWGFKSTKYCKVTYWIKRKGNIQLKAGYDYDEVFPLCSSRIFQSIV